MNKYEQFYDESKIINCDGCDEDKPLYYKQYIGSGCNNYYCRECYESGAHNC